MAISTQKWRTLRDLQIRPSVRTRVDDCIAFVQGREPAISLAAEAGLTVEDMEQMTATRGSPPR